MMRHIHKNKITVVMLKDSVSGESSLSTWQGKTVRLWVRHNDFKIVDVFVLGEDEPNPEPQECFAYGLGLIA